MARRVLNSLDGRKVGTDHEGYLVAKGFRAGVDGKQIDFPGPSRVVLFEDFAGLGLNPKFVFTEGTDSTTSDGAIVSGAVNGVFRLTAGDSAGTSAADGAMLNSALMFKANAGNLVFEAKLSIAAITTVSIFVGLTDTVALEGPVSLSGRTFTTNATDAVGFLFDTAATTDTLRLVGVANDVDATMQDTSLAFVAATDKTLRIEVATDGSAVFYIDGVQVGTAMSGAVTPTVALTPVVIIRPEGAVAGRTADIDYVMVAQDRAA